MYKRQNRQLAEHKKRLNDEYQKLTNEAFNAGSLNITVRLHRDLEAAELECEKLRKQLNVFREAIDKIKELAQAIWHKITDFLLPKMKDVEKEFEAPEKQPKPPKVASWEHYR